jgi:hypothetical protein
MVLFQKNKRILNYSKHSGTYLLLALKIAIGIKCRIILKDLQMSSLFLKKVLRANKQVPELSDYEEDYVEDFEGDILNETRSNEAEENKYLSKAKEIVQTFENKIGENTQELVESKSGNEIEQKFEGNGFDNTKFLIKKLLLETFLNFISNLYQCKRIFLCPTLKHTSRS